MGNTHNKKFFTNINEQSAYWGGFLAADGSVRYNRIIRLCLAEKDKELIEGFKNAIGATHNIYRYTRKDGGTQVSLDIHGAHDNVLALKSIYTISDHKTNTLCEPNLLSEKHIKAFILGYFDGDGSIYKRRNNWCVSWIGTYRLITWIKQQLSCFVVNIGNPSVYHDNSGQCRITFEGRQCDNILTWLYSVSVLPLNRKYNRFLKAQLDWQAIDNTKSSAYKGVSYNKHSCKWKSTLVYLGSYYHLGYFNVEREAALAYNNKARELGLEDRCYAII